jgi:hypothetical protein
MLNMVPPPFSFCDELKADIIGFVRSANTHLPQTLKGSISAVAGEKENSEILFCMESGYFDEDINKIIESAGCLHLIKGKEFPMLASQVTAPYREICAKRLP